MPKRDRAAILRPVTLVLAWMIGSFGCTAADPVAPAGWTGSRSSAANPAAFDEPEAALQVLICQGQSHGTHAGLRILRGDGRTVFWDPAGQYGIDRHDLRRSRDVFVSDTPTVAQYVRWRFDGAGDSAVLLFEWKLTPQRASHFADILTHDAVVPEGEEEFETSTVGLFCCNAICKFLDRFAGEEMVIPTFWFRPERLGAHLWSQQPDRVGLFRKDGTAEVFTAPDHAARQPPG